jgi:hypothetical protein
MPYNYTIAQERDLLRIEVEGKRKLEDSLAVWDMIAERCATSQIARVIVTLRLSGRLTTTDHYYLGDYASKVLQEAAIDRAAVVDLNQQSLPDNQFGETVVRNRGARVAVFDEPDEAEQWITATS